MASAQFYISLNGGANQSGGVDAESEDNVQLVIASNVGWLRARFEIYDKPEGWSTPAGWSAAADGTVYWDWDGNDPPDFDLPDNGETWGVWMLRCLVNEQLDDSENEIEGLLDDENAICLPSPGGLRDCGAREGQHFTTTTTRIKNWLRSYQRNLRALENPRIEFETLSTAVPVVARRWRTQLSTSYSFRALINVSNGQGEYAEYEVKAAYDKASGTLTQMYAPVVTTNAESATLAGSGPHVAVTPDGNDAVELVITGDATLDLSWAVSEMALQHF